MNDASTALLRALDAVKQHLPNTVNDILRGQMTPDRQHEFADLLIELGRLLHDDATQSGLYGADAPQDTPPEKAPKIVAREEEQS